MTRSTHLPSPSPEQIRALLESQGWSAYRAAPMIGVTAATLQQALRGETTLRGGHWKLLRIMAAAEDWIRDVTDDRARSWGVHALRAAGVISAERAREFEEI